jgi:hypothetical protein
MPDTGTQLTHRRNATSAGTEKKNRTGDPVAAVGEPKADSGDGERAPSVRVSAGDPPLRTREEEQLLRCEVWWQFEAADAREAQIAPRGVRPDGVCPAEEVF